MELLCMYYLLPAKLTQSAVVLIHHFLWQVLLLLNWIMHAQYFSLINLELHFCTEASFSHLLILLGLRYWIVADSVTYFLSPPRLAHQSGIMIIFIRDNQHAKLKTSGKFFFYPAIELGFHPIHESGLILSSLLHACYYRVRSKSQSWARVSYIGIFMTKCRAALSVGGGICVIWANSSVMYDVTQPVTMSCDL